MLGEQYPVAAGNCAVSVISCDGRKNAKCRESAKYHRQMDYAQYELSRHCPNCFSNTQMQCPYGSWQFQQNTLTISRVVSAISWSVWITVQCTQNMCMISMKDENMALPISWRGCWKELPANVGIAAAFRTSKIHTIEAYLSQRDAPTLTTHNSIIAMRPFQISAQAKNVFYDFRRCIQTVSAALLLHHQKPLNLQYFADAAFISSCYCSIAKS